MEERGHVHSFPVLNVQFSRQFIKHLSLYMRPHRDTGSLSQNAKFISITICLCCREIIARGLLQPYFPVNFLRNVALEHAKTKYIFLNDVDFEPMPRLEDQLKKYISEGYLQGKTVGS